MKQNPKHDPGPQAVDYSKLMSEMTQHFERITRLLENRQETFTSPDKLRPAEVCKKMGWSRSKFEQFKRDGAFRTVKIGGMVFVYASDLNKLFPEDFF
ncbi:hypothetical protein [Runella aurantiaca]|uniref:DNA-binding protein n=1 Tax=Runella aurantiaca TaxID=2282308 RepID=A0A369I9J8_9BACT|nr:hypothetical protein [Runella aurantiaca]RDB03844.1 hypothetical protein DVG78_21570 [Runella aurantiaca]